MNTKDYIENKKSKKLSNILKGVLATGLVVGSMVTSTACKPNQPQESTSTTNSSTSTIETTTTTSQTTTETISTTETTKIDEPIIRTDDQVEKFNKAMQSITGEDVEPRKQIVIMQKLVSEDNDTIKYNMQICKKTNDNIYIMLREFEISESDYDYIASLYKRVANLTDYDLNGDFNISSQYLTKNFDDKTLQIITNTIIEHESTNQSSQDDLVR